MGRFADAFDTEFREWIANLAAGNEPTGPSAWDGYAVTAITSATVQALESGRVVATDHARPHQQGTQPVSGLPTGRPLTGPLRPPRPSW